MNAKIKIELPFKKLSGLITQTGSSPPELKLFNNDFGVINTVYVTEGVYNIEPVITGQFPVEITIYPQPYQEYGANQKISITRGGDNFMQLNSFDGGDSPANGIFSNNYFEVIVQEKIIEVVS